MYIYMYTDTCVQPNAEALHTSCCSALGPGVPEETEALPHGARAVPSSDLVVRN